MYIRSKSDLSDYIKTYDIVSIQSNKNLMSPFIAENTDYNANVLQIITDNRRYYIHIIFFIDM